MADYEALTIEREGHVATITFTRPDLLNRFDVLLHEEFREALLELRADKEARAAVLASTGKAFSAGGDFDMILEAQQNQELRDELVNGARDLLGTLIDVPQPIVVAMQGAAIGLGATVALACDAIVAPKSAQIADSHVVAGLTCGDGGCLVWPAAAGMLRAKRHLLTGDPLTAEEAFSLGLVTDLVDEPEETLPAATKLATRIASLPPIAVQTTKRVFNNQLQHRASEVLDLSMSFEDKSLASEDVVEAVNALKERRAGNYSGR